MFYICSFNHCIASTFSSQLVPNTFRTKCIIIFGIRLFMNIRHRKQLPKTSCFSYVKCLRISLNSVPKQKKKSILYVQMLQILVSGQDFTPHFLFVTFPAAIQKKNTFHQVSRADLSSQTVHQQISLFPLCTRYLSFKKETMRDVIIIIN